MEKGEIVKDVMVASTPIINALTETLFKPKIKELATAFNIKKKNFDHLVESKFNQYLLDAYAKHSIINTIVFHNQQKLLKSLYIPLTVVDQGGKQFKIEEYNKKFLPIYQRILITDTAGMGKSTIMKRLFLSIIDNGEGIPILIELRRLSRSKTIVDEILEQLTSVVSSLN